MDTILEILRLHVIRDGIPQPVLSFPLSIGIILVLLWCKYYVVPSIRFVFHLDAIFVECFVRVSVNHGPNFREISQCENITIITTITISMSQRQRPPLR